MPSHSGADLTVDPDVLIIGGGAAGVAAAVGAASEGLSVTLLEKNEFPGGKATAAYVATICGLYYRNETGEPEFVHGGFPREFALRLAKKSDAAPFQFKNGLHFLTYRQEDFISVCKEYLDQSNISAGYHALAVKSHTENNFVKQLEVVMNNQNITFSPKVVIDTSGEDLVASLSGVKGIEEDKYQAAAQVFQLSGIDERNESVLNLGMMRSVQKGIAEQLLDASYERLSVVPGSIKDNSVVLKLPLPFEINSKSPDRSFLENYSRNAVKKITGYLINHCELFSQAEISFIAPEVGIRTGPRNLGKEILTRDMVLGCVKNASAIARGSWPVEFWQPNKSVKLEYFDMNGYYDISAGALQSNQLQNLFFGGRNISADASAIASARVIGTCLATGYAAGMLAAGKAKNIPMQVTLEKIRLHLHI